MRVLVTRPDPGGERTAVRLAALGHDVVRMPLFETEITATPDDVPPASEVGGFIATSARAFSLFRAGNLPEKDILDIPVHVVGPATAQAARDTGFADIREAGGTAQDLARTLTSGIGMADSSARGKHVIYLAGAPRTPVIEDALRAAGQSFSVLECYKMTEISYSTDIIISVILSPAPEAVLFYSASAAQRFSALLLGKDVGNALDSTRFVCLSPAIRTELPDRWRARSIATDHPNEDSLLASLAALG